MLELLTSFESLFQPLAFDPAPAAALTLLAAGPSCAPPPHLNRALQAVAPHLTDEETTGWSAVLAEPMRKAAISTPRAVAAFLGQCAVESAGFRALEEDLSYSAVRLCQVWPTRFPNPNAEAAEACAMRPEILANRVYAGRMGNGDEASGDGWRFRGRGLIQISGRAAYQHFATAMSMTLDQAVDHAATEVGAADSAAWFWSANQLNGPANSWSIDLITHKINGGNNGAAERIRLSEAALQAIGA